MIAALAGALLVAPLALLAWAGAPDLGLLVTLPWAYLLTEGARPRRRR